MNWLDRPERKIFVYGRPVDMRKGFKGLQVLVRRQLEEDPLNGDLFVFVNRRGNILKCLLWDRTGFVTIAKKLERGTFRLRNKETKIKLNQTQFSLLFDGIKVGGKSLSGANERATNCPPTSREISSDLQRKALSSFAG